jgi:hypothetical protein
MTHALRVFLEWVLIVLSGLLIPTGLIAVFRCARSTKTRKD